MIDSARVAEVTAAMVRDLDENFPDAKLGQVVIVAEVLEGDVATEASEVDDEAEEDGRIFVKVQSSDVRAWTVLGLLTVAMDAQRYRYEDTDPD